MDKKNKIGKRENELEESIYDEETVEEMLDNDEISAEEEAFMKGYMEEQEQEQ